MRNTRNSIENYMLPYTGIRKYARNNACIFEHNQVFQKRDHTRNKTSHIQICDIVTNVWIKLNV